ncbi:sugar ABC transporter permease [Arthrobacter oryzae]|uniref:carbohydrate ABC transporter permease n=1 Tax=Arthrobacter oryzae TaxID=409290 RepID=UPI0028596B19|nr:sugar ABC transporter permease [Arthrobacter oryzae]MDR6507669.1 multiple sugar transport system permease protein [Arthrobacter oryzae]
MSAPALRPKGLNSSLHTRRAYTFLAPALFFVLVLFIIPLGYNIFISFFDWSAVGRKEFNGLENYIKVLSSERFLNAAGNTMYFTVLAVPIGVVLSLMVALGFNTLLITKVTGFIRALYFAPVVASLTAVAFVWLWIFNPAYGLANDVLGMFGLGPQPWLTDESQAIPSLAIMYVWARLGFNVIILLAGLQAIDRSYYEAARIDGAGPLRMFWSITLPLLNRQLVLVISVEVMNAIKLFELPFVATKGGPVGSTRSIVMEIYELAFRADRWGEAAVYVIFLFVFLLVVTGLIRKLFTRDISE